MSASFFPFPLLLKQNGTHVPSFIHKHTHTLSLLGLLLLCMEMPFLPLFLASVTINRAVHQCLSSCPMR